MSGKDTELTIVTESGRCSWGRCIFCSFSKKPAVPEPDFTRLKNQLDSRLTRCFGTVKYLNSGSFLDERQIPPEFQAYLVERCVELGVKNLVIECLPSHITHEKLKILRDANRKNALNIHFALGLEVADDIVLKKIRKGFTVSDYLDAVSLLKQEGFFVRTYLMANLPYVEDIAKSLDESVRFAEKHSNTIAIINTYAYGYAPLFDMWLEKKWSPLDSISFGELTKKYISRKNIELYFDDYIAYPRFRKEERFVGATEANLENPVYDVWQDYIVRFYRPPEIKRYALFLPCSYRKPYSGSRTHRQILKRLKSLPFYSALHQVMISNPGVIPREFECKYPFAHYDWPEWEETAAIKKKYIEVTGKRITRYLKAHRYEKVFSYLKPSSESFSSLKRACTALKIPLVSCADETRLKEIDVSNPLLDRVMLDSFARCLRNNIIPRDS